MAFLGFGNLEKQKIPFDLKISRLYGSHWDRNNLQRLATQLLNEQGNERISFENRITICFDKSRTSSVPFLEVNRILLWQKFIQLIFNPKDSWHWIPEYQCWHAVILIEKGEYHLIQENHAHNIGEGLREPEKAIFSTSFLSEVAVDSEGLLEVNPNDKAHGCDGWIWLPTKMLENK